MVCPPLWWCCVQGACPVPCFCSQILRSGSWVSLVFLYLVVHNLPNCACTHMQLFLVSYSFLCVLLISETFVQVQALQQMVPGPSLSHKHQRAGLLLTRCCVLCALWVEAQKCLLNEWMNFAQIILSRHFKFPLPHSLSFHSLHPLFIFPLRND